MARLSAFLYFYPFAPSGSLLFGVAVVLLGSGLARRNPYALFLAFLALAVLAVLAAAGRIQAGRAARAPLQWDSSATLVARRSEPAHSLNGEPARLLPFFRHHFALWATLTAGRGAKLRLLREVSFSSSGREPSSASSYPFALNAPMCGPLDCRGRFTVRDLFGLTRSRYGEDSQRRLTVQPASWSPKGVPPIQPAVGQEEKSRRRSSDEDRYYMREYMPGDRFRDINWKVSSRLNELITRVPPPTQERTTLLEVTFRNFRDPAPETVESLTHLNVLKSWLLAFLRRMKSEHPEVQFRIHTASAVEMIAAEDDINRLAWELAAEFFAGEGASAPIVDGELFVFSTPFDRTLARFLAAHSHSRIHLFRTAFAPPGTASPGREPLRLLADPLEDLPGRWALRHERGLREERRPRPERPSAARVTGSPLPGGGSLTEEAFSVRVF